jgi:hypothetical protein
MREAPLVERMILAFGEEIERQQDARGWAKGTPFKTWPQDEQDACIAAMSAALNVAADHIDCDCGNGLCDLKVAAERLREASKK